MPITRFDLAEAAQRFTHDLGLEAQLRGRVVQF
jgi:hypothetical protein